MDTLFLEIETDLNRDFQLKTNAYNLSEVTLEDNRLNVESSRTSVISISKEEIKNVPQLLASWILLKPYNCCLVFNLVMREQVAFMLEVVVPIKI